MRRWVLLAAAALLTCPSASATWSIVILNRITREIGVAQATCIANVNLVPRLPAIRVGEGVGIVQANWDFDGSRRVAIWNGLAAGATPLEILADLRLNTSNHQSFQYGLVSFDGPPVTFTGAGAGLAQCGLAGRIGDFDYAIQGNIMTGAAVCAEAERMLRETDGDLLARLLAANEGARSMGGDGRCSCSQSAPTSCGSPPANFTKSAHTAFLIVTRLGDANGSCGAGHCADGDYFLKRRAVGDGGDIDPILALVDKVALWRADLAGVTDQRNSVVTRGAQELVADGLSATTVTLHLVDIDGVPLTVGGQSVSITPVHAGPDPATVGGLVDHGDGTFSFELVATTDAGRGAWEVRVDDGVREVLLWPPVGVEVLPLAGLHSSWYEVSAAAGADVTLTLNRGALEAGRPYLLLASTAGVEPGSTISGASVPLNPSRLLDLSLAGLGAPVFTGFQGVLDAGGRAEAHMLVSPLLAAPLVGRTFDFAALLGGAGAAWEATNADGFQIRP